MVDSVFKNFERSRKKKPKKDNITPRTKHHSLGCENLFLLDNILKTLKEFKKESLKETTSAKNLDFTGGYDAEHGRGRFSSSGVEHSSCRELEHELAGDLQPIWGLLSAGKWGCGGGVRRRVAVSSTHLVLSFVPQKQPLII